MVRSLLVVAAFGTFGAFAAPAAAQPSATPPVAAPVPAAAAPSVMDNRWSVNLQFGWQTYTVEHADKPKTTFGAFALSGHVRIVPAIDVGLVLLGGGSDANLTMGGFYLEGRYRFHAERPWNFYGSLRLGAMAVANKEATDTEKKGRGSLSVGFGVERRWTHLAVNAEVHVSGVGENVDVTEPMPITRAYELERFGLSAGGVVLGAAYYF